MSDAEAEQSGRELAAEALCDQSRKIVGVFTIAVIFLLVQVPYLFVVERSSSLFVVAVLNVLGSGGFAVVSGSALWFCRQRAE
ncbi:MAG: hypothetical protein ABEJ26_13670 [Halosimplex sp.]